METIEKKPRISAAPKLTLSDYYSDKRSDLNKNGVYCIYHTQKPNVFYIGSASKIEIQRYWDHGFNSRWRSHLAKLSNGIHYNRRLQSVVNDFGLSGIRFKIIEFCEPKVCRNKELDWITYYVQNAEVYNTHILSPSGKGQVRPPEIGKKVSEAKIVKRPVFQFSLTGELINEYPSLNAAEKTFPLNSTRIRACLLGENNTSMGFIWSYSSQFEHRSYNRSKPVLQLTIDGKFINEFLSLTDAKLKTGCKHIGSCCNGNRKSAGGFIWKFKPLPETISKKLKIPI